jgi:hypothetical protein
VPESFDHVAAETAGDRSPPLSDEPTSMVICLTTMPLPRPGPDPTVAAEVGHARADVGLTTIDG